MGKTMMIPRARKGQVFIVILIVLLGIVVGFAVLSAHEAQVRSTPMVQEVSWQLRSQRIASVSVGEEVEAHIVVKATQEYVGSIVVKVRKDISFWVDSDYSIKTFSVILKGDQVTELELSLVPDEASTGRLRGYFVEISFSATHTDWVMENSYPPRLKVLPQPK